MKVEVEDLSPVKKKLTVELPAGELAKEIEGAYLAIKSSAALPGFRKGKVPDNVLRRHYGEKVMGEVATRLLERSYSEAVKEKSLSPVQRPEIEMKKMAEGEPFIYSATFEVAPVISVTGYRGLDLKREDLDVKDSEVEEGLGRLRKDHGEFKDVEREARKGDMAVVDFEGFIDGKPIEKGKATDFSVILGEGHLLPGFDEAIEGKKAGDEVEVDTSFPETYQDSGVAGKAAHFKVTVKSVKELKEPTLDDDFARDLECESLDALREKIRGELSSMKKKNDNDRLRAEALDKLLAANVFDVPPSLVESYLANILSSLTEDLKRAGQFPKDETAMAALQDRYREVAEKRAKADLIVDAIAEKEGVEVTAAELDKAVAEFAKRGGMAVDVMRARLEKEGSLGVIEESLKRDKVFEILTESRVVIEP